MLRRSTKLIQKQYAEPRKPATFSELDRAIMRMCDIIDVHGNKLPKSCIADTYDAVVNFSSRAILAFAQYMAETPTFSALGQRSQYLIVDTFKQASHLYYHTDSARSLLSDAEYDKLHQYVCTNRASLKRMGIIPAALNPDQLNPATGYCITLDTERERRINNVLYTLLNTPEPKPLRKRPLKKN